MVPVEALEILSKTILSFLESSGQSQSFLLKYRNRNVLEKK